MSFTNLHRGNARRAIGVILVLAVCLRISLHLSTHVSSHYRESRSVKRHSLRDTTEAPPRNTLPASDPIARQNAYTGNLSSDHSDRDNVTTSNSLAAGFGRRADPVPVNLEPDYERALCRGTALMEKMNDWKHSLPTFKIPQPDPNHPDEEPDIFKLYGYEVDPIKKYEADEMDDSMKPLFVKVGAPPLSDEYWGFDAELPNTPNPDPEYQIQQSGDTEPSYNMAFHPQSVVIGMAIGPGLIQPGKLTRSSDIIFLAYARVCKDKDLHCDPRKIKVIIRKEVVNDSTLKIIKRVRDDKTEAERSSLKTFEWDTDEFKALLGSVNGLAAAWIIIDHAKWFYAKRIGRIHSFRGNTQGLAYEIEDIPNSGPPPPHNPNPPPDPAPNPPPDSPPNPPPNPAPNTPPDTVPQPPPNSPASPAEDPPLAPPPDSPRDPMFPDAPPPMPDEDFTMGEAPSPPPPADTDHPMPDAPPPPPPPADTDSSMGEAPPRSTTQAAATDHSMGEAPPHSTTQAADPDHSMGEAPSHSTSQATGSDHPMGEPPHSTTQAADPDHSMGEASPHSTSQAAGSDHSMGEAPPHSTSQAAGSDHPMGEQPHSTSQAADPDHPMSDAHSPRKRGKADAAGGGSQPPITSTVQEYSAAASLVGMPRVAAAA